MSTTLHDLSAARNALTATAEHSEKLQAEQDALQERLAQAKQQSADAINAHRTKAIDEATAALRMAAAQADIEDLNALIEAGKPAIDEANALHRKAVERATVAEQSARREELHLTSTQLDQQIKVLENTLIEALAERYRVHVSLNGTRGGQSLFNCWQPVEALKRAVIYNAPPGH